MAIEEPSFWRRVEREAFAKANAKLKRGKRGRWVGFVSGGILGAIRMVVTPADPNIATGLFLAACAGLVTPLVAWFYDYATALRSIPAEWDTAQFTQLRSLESEVAALQSKPSGIVQLAEQCGRLSRAMDEYLAECNLKAPFRSRSDLLMGDEFSEFGQYWRRVREAFRVKFERDVLSCALRARALHEVETGEGGVLSDAVKNIVRWIVTHGLSEDMDTSIRMVRDLGMVMTEIGKPPPSDDQSH